jgi:hypothetical protein
VDAGHHVQRDRRTRGEFERLSHTLGPQRASGERVGQRLLEQAREWLERQNRSMPCDEALPACGMTPAL